MKFIFAIIIDIFIIGLFLYLKLVPYKERLNDKNRRIYDFFDGIFSPILNFLKQIFKPTQVGQGLSIEMGSIVLLIILLLLINLM